MMSEHEAWHAAREHVATWNTHDLDRIMDLYTDDVQLVSPLASSLTSDGTLRGKQALRSYFEAALEKHPDLQFRLQDVFGGLDSLTLLFRSVQDKLVAEVLFFEGRRIKRVFAHYQVPEGAGQVR